MPVPKVDVVVRGPVPSDAAEYMRSRISAVAAHAHGPILFVRAKLTQVGDPAVARPSIAQVNLDVNGRLVRAHVAAENMREAIDLLVDRLRQRIDRMAQHWEARRGGMSSVEQHEWRHGSEPSHRPDYYPRPADEREIVRHKSFALALEAPDEAAFEMDAMDYDFHLFTDATTGLDSVVYRAGPTGYRLAYTGLRPGTTEPTAVGVTVSPHAAPRLRVAEAIDRLELTGQPFVFFVNADGGRGSVLYHRYDGHYGLITPAA